MRYQTEAIRELLRAYEQFGRSPDSLAERKECATAHRRMLASLDEDFAHLLDGLLVAEKDHRAAADALQTLEETQRDFPERLARERELAEAAGFEGDDFEDYLQKARKALRKDSVECIPPRNTADIRSTLHAVHERVCEAFHQSREDRKRVKEAHREDAKEYFRMQLFMVCSLVTNADEKGIFHVSHATCVGMARVRPKRRKRLVLATADRPFRAWDGNDPLPEAA